MKGYLAMSKRFILNRNKNIGSVIFILEGSKTEFQLLEKVFVDLLGYQIHELRRNHTTGFEFHGTNPYSRVVAINFKGNHLFDINTEEQDRLFLQIRTELNIKPENTPIYYIYDRDVKSYHIDEVQTFVEKYQDPYGTTQGDLGQLLLSYPSIESYTVSCFCEHTHETSYELGKDLKQYAAENSYTIQMIRKDSHILHAVTELDEALEHYGITEYDLDDLGKTLLNIYQVEQKCYLAINKFGLLSTLSFVLLELGIIEIEEDTDTPNETEAS